jgi:glycosyltransferase involved in cell wall biosynthesis
MTSLPLVSVILPVYNAERFLRTAIESILNQTYRNLELIIVNDCSRDGSLSIALEMASRDKRVRVLSNPENIKLSRSLNRAIESSKGMYLARMDADDVSSPLRIERQVRVLEENQEIAIVGCNIAIIDETGQRIGHRNYYSSDDEIRKKIFFFSPFCHPAIMIRKQIIDQTGAYDHSYNPAEDYELYFRLGKMGKFHNIDEELFTYRIVSDSMTQGGTLNMERKTIEVRKKYANTPGYPMPMTAAIYNFGHRVSLALVSPAVRVKVFNFIRQKLN